MRIGNWLFLLEKDRDSAWETLWTSLSAVPRGVALRHRLPSRLVEEEAVPEAVIRLMRDTSPLRTVRSTTELSSFLWGYLRNVTREILRNEHRKREATLALAKGSSAPPPATCPDCGTRPHEEAGRSPAALSGGEEDLRDRAGAGHRMERGQGKTGAGRRPLGRRIGERAE